MYPFVPYDEQCYPCYCDAGPLGDIWDVVGFVFGWCRVSVWMV